MKKKAIAILDKAKYTYCFNEDDQIVIDLKDFDLTLSFYGNSILFKINWDYYEVDEFILHESQQIANTIKKMINRVDKIKKTMSKSKIKLNKIKKDLSFV